MNADPNDEQVDILGNCNAMETIHLGGSSCMVKMRPKLPLRGTAKKKFFLGGPKTQEPKIL